MQARATFIRNDGVPAGAVVVADSQVVPPMFSAVLADGSPLWIVNRQLPSDQSRELHFIGHSREVPEQIARMPNPYVRSFRATQIDPANVLLAGAKWEGSYAVSLLIRDRVECNARSDDR